MSDNTHQRVMNMVARARVRASNDANGMQFTDISLLKGEAKSKVERFQQYGLSSVPPVGSEAITLFIGGNRDHAVIVATDSRAGRLRAQAEGEVALYSNEGDFIVLKRGNTIKIVTDRLIVRADVEVIIEAPKVTIQAAEINIEGAISLTGNLTVTGDITASGSIDAPNGNVGGG